MYNPKYFKVMSILFEWYESPVAPHQEGKKPTLHPRIILNGKSSTQDIANIIQARSTVHPADIAAVLASLSEVIGEEIGRGARVHLNGIGSFYPTLTTTEEINEETKQPTKKVILKTIEFQPDKELKNAVKIYGFEHTKYASHSAKLTDTEIDAKLEEYFRTHDVLQRRNFEELCNLNRTTAGVRLHQLREAGKLKNIGLSRHPIYVPMPGFYGKESVEE